MRIYNKKKELSDNLENNIPMPELPKEQQEMKREEEKDAENKSVLQGMELKGFAGMVMKM